MAWIHGQRTYRQIQGPGARKLVAWRWGVKVGMGDKQTNLRTDRQLTSLHCPFVPLPKRQQKLLQTIGPRERNSSHKRTCFDDKLCKQTNFISGRKWNGGLGQALINDEKVDRS